jgi:hypothetical protein
MAETPVGGHKFNINMLSDVYVEGNAEMAVPYTVRGMMSPPAIAEGFARPFCSA